MDFEGLVFEVEEDVKICWNFSSCLMVGVRSLSLLSFDIQLFLDWCYLSFCALHLLPVENFLSFVVQSSIFHQISSAIQHISSSSSIFTIL